MGWLFYKTPKFSLKLLYRLFYNGHKNSNYCFLPYATSVGLVTFNHKGLTTLQQQKKDAKIKKFKFNSI